MRLDYELPKTGHPNCRRPDKVIDAASMGVLLVPSKKQDTNCCKQSAANKHYNK